MQALSALGVAHAILRALESPFRIEGQLRTVVGVLPDGFSFPGKTQVWVEAANPGERLKLGTTVEVSIDAGEVPDALIVPASALLNSDDGGEKVMVAGSDSLAHERSVKVGIHSGDDVQILDGLKPGDQVITQGALGLDDKAKIEIKKPGTKDEDDK